MLYIPPTIKPQQKKKIIIISLIKTRCKNCVYKNAKLISKHTIK